MKELEIIDTNLAPVVETGTGQLEIGTPEPIVPRTKTGKVRWNKLARSPIRFETYVRFEANRLVAEGYSLTSSGISESGRSSLKGPVRKFYPGGLNGLKIDLMFYQPKEKQEIVDLSILVGKSGKILWASLAANPGRLNQVIQDKARQFVAQGHRLTIRELRENGEARLRLAAKKLYEGGLLQLQRDLGVEYKKPAGFWCEDKIEEEAIKFYGQYGELTPKSLRSNGRADLMVAIRSKYPGGFTVLKGKIGVASISSDGILASYEQIIEAGELTSFAEFVKGEK